MGYKIHEGGIYENEDFGYLVEVTRVPDQFGVPTHRAESQTIDMKRLDNDEVFDTFRDSFHSTFTLVAKNKDELK